MNEYMITKALQTNTVDKTKEANWIADAVR